MPNNTRPTADLLAEQAMKAYGLQKSTLDLDNPYSLEYQAIATIAARASAERVLKSSDLNAPETKPLINLNSQKIGRPARLQVTSAQKPSDSADLSKQEAIKRIAELDAQIADIRTEIVEQVNTMQQAQAGVQRGVNSLVQMAQQQAGNPNIREDITHLVEYHVRATQTMRKPTPQNDAITKAEVATKSFTTPILKPSANPIKTKEQAEDKIQALFADNTTYRSTINQILQQFGLATTAAARINNLVTTFNSLTSMRWEIADKAGITATTSRITLKAVPIPMPGDMVHKSDEEEADIERQYNKPGVMGGA